MHLVVDGRVECAAAAAERACVCGLVRLVRSDSVARLRDVRYVLVWGGGLVLLLTLQNVSAFDRSRGLARCIWLLTGVSSVLLPLLLSVCVWSGAAGSF